MQDRAIICDVNRGPCFSEIGIVDGCNATMANYSGFMWRPYTGTTGADSGFIFSSSDHFAVKEIEVFEITG
jgi:hypothetical protein